MTFDDLRVGALIRVEVPRGRVFDGCDAFTLADTRGFPLADTLSRVMALGMLLDWRGYIVAAQKQGWEGVTIASRIKEASVDSGYGSDYIRRTFKCDTE